MSSAGVLTFQVLNETHQAFGSQFNTLIDQNGNQVQYNVRINQDEFEFIKQGGFADTGTYDYNGPLGTNKRLLQTAGQHQWVYRRWGDRGQIGMEDLVHRRQNLQPGR